MKRLLAVFVAMFVGAGTANATDFAVGPNISTLGYGVEVPVKINSTFVMRFGGNMFNYNASTAAGDMTYNTDISFRTFGALLDFHPLGTGFIPFGNGLLVSGGLYYNGNQIDLVSTPTLGATIGGVSYTGAEIGTVNGKLDFGTFSPYLGVGYDNTFYSDWRLSLSMRVGVMMMRGATVSLTGTGAAAGTAAFQADLAAEQQKVQDALDKFGFFPVVSVGIRYRF